jgi:hypothetical protein
MFWDSMKSKMLDKACSVILERFKPYFLAFSTNSG